MKAAHPLNFVLRSLLEVSALAAACIYGWGLTDGPLRVVTGIGLSVALAVVWGTFAVPDDPSSRSGNAPVRLPGFARLALELTIFGLACWVLYSTGAVAWSLAVGGGTAVHYGLSLDRIVWLLRSGSAEPRSPE